MICELMLVEVFLKLCNGKMFNPNSEVGVKKWG